MSKSIDLQITAPHVRILIMGRVGCGKTTILKRVCNSIEDPEIYDSEGKQINILPVEGSLEPESTTLDIQHQIIFKSSPQYIFHECGIQSGSIDAVEKLATFMAERAQKTELKDQLHAIWYCLPTDTSRPILEADRKFFNDGTGKVPVIAVFTKFDGLTSMAFGELRGSGATIQMANKNSREKALEMLEQFFIEPLKETKFKPSAFVQINDMRKDSSSCAELIEKTAGVLNDDLKR